MIRLLFALAVSVVGFAAVAAWVVRGGEIAAVVETAIPEPVREAVRSEVERFASQMPALPAPPEPPAPIEEVVPRADFPRDAGPSPASGLEDDELPPAGQADEGPSVAAAPAPEPRSLEDSADLIRRMLAVYQRAAERR